VFKVVKILYIIKFYEIENLGIHKYFDISIFEKVCSNVSNCVYEKFNFGFLITFLIDKFNIL